jgi:UTP--glucose-1-phosphate uridylyltransferase
VTQTTQPGLDAALAKMRADGAGDDAVSVFEHYYGELASGATGLIPESSISPLPELPYLGDLVVDPAVARDALAHTVVIKLNGGLATSMGLDRAKSLLPVKDGRSFLDLIVEQVLSLRAEHDVSLPLVLMNSFRTRADSLAALAAYPELAVDDLPLDFLQNREPKLTEDTLEPVSWPADPELEWCPPGHADLYPALRSSGMLDLLLDKGYRYAFCSNADNLGATANATIAGWVASNDLPFAIESCVRTPADRKGGHLAVRRSDGRLILRETAQTAEADLDAMADLTKHRYCNSNNLWVDLRALARVLDETHGVLGLPLIRNVKTVDPADKTTPSVIQIEAAMGAAVQAFDGAASVHVDRDRFVPVKSTNDLTVLRSDVYVRESDGRVVKAAARNSRDDPFVALDDAYYKLMGDYERRFPAGVPSLVDADRFVVEGDVAFGSGVVVQGSVTVRASSTPTVADGTVLTG